LQGIKWLWGNEIRLS